MRVSAFFVVTHLLVSPGALAQEPDWNFIEVSVLISDIDSAESGDDTFDDDDDLTGWEGAASWNFYKWAYLAGKYSYQQEGIGSILRDLELEVLSVGPGAKWSLRENTDLYGEVRYEDWDFQGATVREDDTGYRVAAGIRSVVWQGLELNAEAGYLDVGDVVDGESYFRLGGIYMTGIGLGLGTSYEDIDDPETWRITLRYAFR